MVEIATLHNDVIPLRRDELTAILHALTSMHEMSAHLAATLMAKLDMLDGDPDAEDGDPAEHDGTDQGDQAWTEWTTMRGSQKRGHNLAELEDTEEDDPPEAGGDDDTAVDDLPCDDIDQDREPEDEV